MIDHEPTVTSQDWWRPAADFELFPALHGTRQSVMRGKMAEMIEIAFPAYAAKEIQMLSR